MLARTVLWAALVAAALLLAPARALPHHTSGHPHHHPHEEHVHVVMPHQPSEEVVQVIMPVTEENKPEAVMEENKPSEIIKENQPMEMMEEGKPAEMTEEIKIVEENHPGATIDKLEPMDMTEEKAPLELVEEAKPMEETKIEEVKEEAPEEKPMEAEAPMSGITESPEAPAEAMAPEHPESEGVREESKPEEAMATPDMPAEPMVTPDMPAEPMATPEPSAQEMEPLKEEEVREEIITMKPAKAEMEENKPEDTAEASKKPAAEEESEECTMEEMAEMQPTSAAQTEEATPVKEEGTREESKPEEPMAAPEKPAEIMETPDTPAEEPSKEEETECTPEDMESQPEEMKPMESTEPPAAPAAAVELHAEQPAEEIAAPPKPEDSKIDAAEARSSYEGAQVLRVKAVTPDQKDLINKFEQNGFLDTWLRPARSRTGELDVMVPATTLASFKKRLEDLNTEYRVIIQDVQTAIEAENPAMSTEDLNELEGRKGHRMTWQSYHRLADIHGYLDYLGQSFPDLCTVTTIGNSVEGRPLKMLRISSRKARQATATRPAIWIDGGIHAREWISPAAVTYIIQELVENRENYGAVAEDIDYYILPVVNPDGYEYSHQRERLWRKNRKDPHLGRCAGTDLNRNWGYKWGGAGSSRDQCKEIYAGASAFSEPETQAIRNFVSGQASSLRAYLTFHSYGQYILYPWGYDRKVPPDYADLDSVGKKAAAAMRAAGGASYTVGNSANTLYPASGGADDWAKGGARIKYTYTIELRDRGQYGFLLPATFITPTSKEAFAAVKTVAEAVLAA